MFMGKLKQLLLTSWPLVTIFALMVALQASQSVDPEVNMTIRQVVESNGYLFEEHSVSTKDGYILTLHRIQGKADSKHKKQVFFLQHGLFCDSFFWLLNLPNQNLPFLLADQGSDVWLGNNRGNKYARRHKTLSPDSQEFWDFSWDEMAIYDLPAMLGYIQSQTRSSDIYYVGHSEGTMIAFAGFPKMPNQMTDSIRRFYALAPVATVGHIESPVRKLASLPTVWLGKKGFLTNIQEFLKLLGESVCAHFATDDLCLALVLELAGWSPQNFNKTRLPVYGSHVFSGTSAKNVRHFLQQINSNKFQAFDYGKPALNLAHYNQTEPPIYDLSFRTFKQPPVYAFTGGEDWLADPRDVEYLLSFLASPGADNRRALVKMTDIDNYDHADFVMAISANEKVFKKIIEDAFPTNF